MDYKALIEKLQTEYSLHFSNRYESEFDMLKCAEDAIKILLTERDAAIKILRGINWCAGCIHFRGIEGCANNTMSLCCEGDDHYQFCGQQKEGIRK